MASKIGGATLEGDTVLRTLSQPKRRSILKQVCDHAGPIAAEDLATAIAATENGTSVDERTRVLRSLRHVHLPKLADARLIEYDRTSEIVTATERSNDALATFERARL